MLPVALVIIGRNEARHLQQSLPVITGLFKHVVYVDSGSTDESCQLAKQYQAEVVELDTSIPFTAARARNAGFDALKQYDDHQYVQFIDGDCELIPDYVHKAVEWLVNHPEYAMVCGRRLERFPERSIFNRLCHLEWNTPVGEAEYCGGDVMIRVDALNEVNGYDPALIAGEDPEVCVRLRQVGWRIYRIESDMTWHDANITGISQWWKRQERAGHAFAEGAFLHGDTPQKHWVKETRSNWFWGAVFWGGVMVGFLVSPWLFVLLLVFPVQAFRLALNVPDPMREQSFKMRLMYGLDCYFAKLPQFVGQLKFTINKAINRRQKLIEYK